MQCLYAYTYMFFMPEYSSMVSAAVKKTLTKRNLGYERAYLTHLSSREVKARTQARNLKAGMKQKP